MAFVVLLGLTLLASVALRRARGLPPAGYRAVVGVSFGLVGMITLSTSFVIVPGLIGDLRNVAVAAAAVFGGGIGAVIAGTMVALFRVYLGGFAISGVLGILTAAMLGVLFYVLWVSRRPVTRPREYFAFGLILAVTTAVVPFQSLFWPTGADAAKSLYAFKVVLVAASVAYPIAFTLLCEFVAGELRRTENEAALAAMVMELSRSNTELARFAYLAAHDLKEPVRGINCFLDLLGRSCGAKLSERESDFLRFARAGASQIGDLMNDLLVYATSVDVPRPFRPVDMNDALAQAITYLREADPDPGFRLETERLPTVAGDRVQLALLFQHLIGNAIKFRRPEVDLVIRVATARDGKEWTFSVADNGIGIEGRYLQRIFDVFARLHTRDKYPGTGLGLALCRKIVGRHGGRIWAEGRPGEGTTLFFVLPTVV